MAAYQSGVVCLMLQALWGPICQPIGRHTQGILIFSNYSLSAVW